jgi:hypothetical protein
MTHVIKVIGGNRNNQLYIWKMWWGLAQVGEKEYVCRSMWMITIISVTLKLMNYIIIINY